MITLSKSGNTVTFTFDENSGYLQNGTIDVPVNSLALIIDESDMATFKKSASNDIFISARYEEFGMPKAELEAWYKANMVSSGGGGGGGVTPGEVQQMIDSSISGKTDTSAFTSYTTSTNSRLAEDEEVTARALIDINDLSENKADVSAVTEIADAISGKADVSAVTAIDSVVSGLTERVGEDEEVTARALIDLDEKKLDASAYTPVDLSEYWTSAQTDNAITEAVSGKLDTSAFETYSGSVDTALSGKQDTLISGMNIKTINNISLLGSGNIDIQGGGGTGTCTVDETTIYDVYSSSYNNSGYDLKVRYVVLNYTEDKTVASNIGVGVQFRDDSYNYYVNQTIYLDYTTSSYTLSNQDEAQYIDITYDPTIEDFKIAVASAYTSTVFVDSVNSWWYGYIKVPFYTISSGSPCTVIENDIPNVVSEIREGLSEAIKSTNMSSQKSTLNCYSQTIGGGGNTYIVKLDEIDGSNNTLKPDIYVGLGTSGWTEINVTEPCSANNLKGTKYRVTYDYSEFNAYLMGLSLSVVYAGNQSIDYVVFDDQTQQPSLQSSTFTGATVDWNASTKELVITYPMTIDWYGEPVSVNIEQINSNNCQFGQTIIKLESYGEYKQALKSYVQQNRAALGGLKLQQVTQAQYDALVSGGTVDNSTIYYIVN